jgi:hypothetical protein
MKSNPQTSDRADQAEKPGKREYVKPAFRHEAVFETMALACGKLAGTSAQCDAVPKTS